MLYPIMTESRMLIDLCGWWKFRLEKQKDMVTMPVPASAGDFNTFPEFRNHCGWMYYQKKVSLPEIVRKQRTVVRFEAVAAEAEIWLNSCLIKEHGGSSQAFEVEITNLLRPGENLLEIGLNYKPDKNTAEDQLIGPVKIYTTPRDYIVDIELNAKTDKKNAVVHYNTQINGNGSVRVEIFDREGVSIAQAIGRSGSLEIPDVILWQPLDSYLYQIKVTFAQDVYVLPYGVRTIKVTAEKIFLNDMPFYFRGYIRDEDDFYSNIRDLSLLKWQNANGLLVFDHPCSEDLLRLCDEEGIVVIRQLPAPADGPHTGAAGDLISNDKNYACVIMWGLSSNCTFDSQEDYDSMKKRIVQVKKADLQRRPCTVLDLPIDCALNTDVQQMDMICLNCNHLIDLKAIQEDLPKGLESILIQKKPVLCIGYGCEAVLGVHDIISDTYTEEYQVMYLKAVHKILDRFPCIAGEIITRFADNPVRNDRPYAGEIYKGVFTKERKPKVSVYYLRSRWKKISKLGQKK